MFFNFGCKKELVLKLTGAMLLVQIICPLPSYAYLDPGTGSMIIQALIAAVVGVGCAFSALKSKIFALFKKDKK